MVRYLRRHQVTTATAITATCAIALTLTGCGGSSGGGGTGAATSTAASAAGSTGSGSASAVSVPSSALITPGKLTVCSDISSPPLEFYTASNVPTGSDVDLGNAMAAKMGLAAVWSNTSFNGIIPALQAKRCDVIMSQLYIKPAREKVVDFVPYMYSGSTFMVRKSGGPAIRSASDLCGKKAAAETGTTVVDFLQQQSAACQKAGKPPIDIRQFNKDPQALQQLKLGLVAAYGTTVETAAYDIKQNPGQFVMAGKPFNRIKVGAATRKNDTALHDALSKALAAIHKDGQYDKIMTKWGLTSDNLPLG